jgi:haloalkane dehalogenase
MAARNRNTKGGLTNEPVVNWSKANLKNLQTIDLGQGIHYLQEDHPKAIGEALGNWIGQLKSKFQ